MENYSYPDSRESSPRSREVDCDTPSWDDQPPPPPPSSTAYKVKLLCSYGGKIQPRPHDNQLAYVGGDTKILAVDRNIKLSAFISKLSSISDSLSDAPPLCFKYQLPGEDLDALISVTNDEDLDHMMIECDRLYRASPKPARLRLFLFPANPPAPASFGSNESKSERQWFVDALNSVQIQSPEGSSPTAPASTNPDFLFGFDKGYAAAVPVAKLPDSVTPPTVPDSLVKNTLAGGGGGGGPELVAEPALSQLEIQRQIHELHRMQIAAGHEPTLYQRKGDEQLPNPRGAYTADYYPQKPPENIAPGPGAAPVPMPAHLQFPTGYLPERHMNTGSYHVAAAPGAGEQQQQQQQPVYLVSTPAGVYQAPPGHRPATGPVGQAYYGVPPQRMVPEVYRDAQVYNTAVAAQQQQQHQQQQQQQAKVAAYSEGFAQVGYDNAGRQVYYTTAGGPVASSYQTVAPVPVPVDARQGGAGGALNQIQDGAR
ncbi:uncharacterized protein LOC126796126 [Argentina anserina]|uniref:uncharacterized protein LOC126796126 n=1 Tax=Argentina anserina TaxID=57926 RepID=UPI002176795C|nr:uncharacterized protein LOC126796126 [Potentilla anserina]